MKKLLFLLIFAVTTTLLSAQSPYVRTFSDIICYRIMPVSDGYVLGGASSIDIVNYAPYPGLLKINNNGDSVWQKNYSFQTSYGPSCFFTKAWDNGFLIVFHEFQASSTKFIRTDANGDTTWTSSLNNFWPTSALTANDSTFIVTGIGPNVAVVAKFAKNGILTWRKTFHLDLTSYALDACNTSDNGYAITGYKSHSNASTTAYIMKLNSDGDSLWGVYYNTYNTQILYDIHQNPNHGFILAGMMDSVGINVAPVGYVLNTDQAGNINWQKIYKNNGEQGFKTIEPNTTTGYIACGTSGADDNAKILLEKLTNDGDVIFASTFLEGLKSVGYHATIANDGSYLVLGEGWLSDQDTVTVVIKSDTSGLFTAVSKIPFAKTLGITVSPNPSTSVATISWNQPFSGSANIDVYSADGRAVKHFLLNDLAVNENHYSLSVADLTSGSYIVRIISGKYSGSCTMIVR